MRDLTKDDYYWGRAMEEAVKAGYREFAITLNPFPGAIEHTTKLAKMAKKRGFEVVNVTTVYKGVFEDEAINPLLPHIDIVSMSVDDMRCKDAEDMWSQVDDAWGYIRQEHPHVHFNINLLWTPTVFQWAEEGQLDYAFESFHYGNREKWSIQHLIYKPTINLRKRRMVLGKVSMDYGKQTQH